MIEIHPTAIVSSKSEIGNNVKIGAYSIISDDVVIDDNTIIGSHVCIYDGGRIGKNVQIYQGASVSNSPQDLKYANEKSFFYIGDNTIIREFVTLHRGTVNMGKSSIGSNCLLMAYSHVAHDCSLGNNVIIANCVQIGGHVHIEDYVIIGGGTPVHQFSKIGKHAMIGGGYRVISDIPPYVLAAGEPLKYSGINVVGLKRRGFSADEIQEIKTVYSLLYNSGLNTKQALNKIDIEIEKTEIVKSILEFINSIERFGFK